MSKRKESESNINWLNVLMTFFILTSIVQLLVGIAEGDDTRKYASCAQPMERIEYILPAYRVGCWLGSPPEKTFKVCIKPHEEIICDE